MKVDSGRELVLLDIALYYAIDMGYTRLKETQTSGTQMGNQQNNELACERMQADLNDMTALRARIKEELPNAKG